MEATKRKSIFFILTAVLFLAANSVHASYYQKTSALHNTSLEKKGLIGEIFTGSKSLGELFDPNVGFYYLRARWMDPVRGRFVSSDRYWVEPSIYIGGKSQIIQHLFGWDECNRCCSDFRNGKTKVAYASRRQKCKMCDVSYNSSVNNPILERVVEAARFTSPSVHCHLNRYLYANASPMNWLDPKGEFALPNLSAAMLITGILASVAVVNYNNLLRGREYLGVEPPGTFKPMEPADLIPQAECFARHGGRMKQCEKIGSGIIKNLCKAKSRIQLSVCLAWQFTILPFK